MPARKRRARGAPGKHAYERLDRVLHEKARLGILTALMTRPDGVRFRELKELCALTDGNLSRHVQVLHEAELIEIWKGFEGKRPQTLVRLSVAGRDQFLAYLAELERVLRDAGAAPSKAAFQRFDAPAGWTPV